MEKKKKKHEFAHTCAYGMVRVQIYFYVCKNFFHGDDGSGGDGGDILGTKCHVLHYFICRFSRVRVQINTLAH